MHINNNSLFFRTNHKIRQTQVSTLVILSSKKGKKIMVEVMPLVAKFHEQEGNPPNCEKVQVAPPV